MNTQSRKRKYTDKMEPENGDLIPPKGKYQVIQDVDEENLSNILFGDSNLFLKSLEEAVNGPQRAHNVDSGIESGTSEEETSSRKPAWTDEDDAGIDVGEALKAQKRKLPSGGINNRKNKYSNLLKQKYEAIVSTPNWANLKKN